MTKAPAFHPVYRSLNKPLTILGIDRRLFFLAVIMGGATFNFFGSLAGGGLMFIALFVAGRWATAHDPQFLRIVINSSRLRAQYDPAKRQDEASPR